MGSSTLVDSVYPDSVHPIKGRVLERSDYSIPETEYSDAVRLMVEQATPAQLAVPFYNKQSILHWAIANGRLDIIRLIIARAPEQLNMVDTDGRRLIDYVLERKEKESSTVRSMVEQATPAQLAVSLYNGQTILHWAIANGRSDIVQLIIAKAPEQLYVADKHGRTAVHLAAANGHLEVVQLIAKRTPEVLTIADKDGRTAIHLAAANGHSEVVSLIAEIDPETLYAVDKDERTAVHLAAANGHSEVVQLIAEQAPETLAVADKEEQYSIHRAAANGCLDIVRLIADRAPEQLDAVDMLGRHPIDLAVTNGYKDVVQFIVEKVYERLVTAKEEYKQLIFETEPPALVREYKSNKHKQASVTKDSEPPIETPTKQHEEIAPDLLARVLTELLAAEAKVSPITSIPTPAEPSAAAEESVDVVPVTKEQAPVTRAPEPLAETPIVPTLAESSIPAESVDIVSTATERAPVTTERAPEPLPLNDKAEQAPVTRDSESSTTVETPAPVVVSKEGPTIEPPVAAESVDIVSTATEQAPVTTEQAPVTRAPESSTTAETPAPVVVPKEGPPIEPPVAAETVVVVNDKAEQAPAVRDTESSTTVETPTPIAPEIVINDKVKQVLVTRDSEAHIEPAEPSAAAEESVDVVPVITERAPEPLPPADEHKQVLVARDSEPLAETSTPIQIETPTPAAVSAEGLPIEPPTKQHEEITPNLLARILTEALAAKESAVETPVSAPTTVKTPAAISITTKRGPKSSVINRAKERQIPGVSGEESIEISVPAEALPIVGKDKQNLIEAKQDFETPTAEAAKESVDIRVRPKSLSIVSLSCMVIPTSTTMREQESMTSSAKYLPSSSLSLIRISSDTRDLESRTSSTENIQSKVLMSMSAIRTTRTTQESFLTRLATQPCLPSGRMLSRNKG